MAQNKYSHAPPVVGIVLLCLPLIYLGSYLCLVCPAYSHHPFLGEINYRGKWRGAARFYWPLEHIDRQLRPDFWSPYADEEMLTIDFDD